MTGGDELRENIIRWIWRVCYREEKVESLKMWSLRALVNWIAPRLDEIEEVIESVRSKIAGLLRRV